MARTRKASVSSSQLRIIGGQWRSRKLTFKAAAGLRPTTDRMRETLFNWLSPWLHDASCLDLFAGSGALGLDALSRGARQCDFVDDSATVAHQISHHLTELHATDRGQCFPMAAAKFLQQATSNYDIVFVDPPFGAGLLEPTCETLASAGLLSEQALIYVERAAQEAEPKLPAQWQLHREKASGGVHCSVYRVNTD